MTGSTPEAAPFFSKNFHSFGKTIVNYPSTKNQFHFIKLLYQLTLIFIQNGLKRLNKHYTFQGEGFQLLDLTLNSRDSQTVTYFLIVARMHRCFLIVVYA